MGASFKQLRVWKDAKDLAVEVYKMTEQGKIARDFSLRDQIRRSAVSISSNIVEGDERQTNKEAARFFYIARGSASELITQLIIAHEIGYLREEKLNKLSAEIELIAKMLYRLIKVREGEGKAIGKR